MKDRQTMEREAQAHSEIGHTDVRRGLSVFLTAVFLLTIGVVPLVQHAVEFRQHRLGARASVIPQCYEILPEFVEAAGIARTVNGNALDRVLAANRAFMREKNRYESALEEGSWLTELCLPACQQVLTAQLGVGNEKAYVGRKRWLFYRYDVEYLTAPGFLKPAWAARRMKARKEWDPKPQPDPVPAIIDFKVQLEKRGVKLIVMPVPTKAVVQPGLMAKRCGKKAFLQNASYEKFMKQLGDAGVEVFDPTELLVDLKTSMGVPQYLAADTHWRPEAMEAAAAALAARVREVCELAGNGKQEYRRRGRVVENTGDVADMLKLRDSQAVFRPERVEMQQVVVDGKRWQPDPSAEILFLGDSFANIYSLKSLGWGESAGLVEQLSWQLRRPVDRIVRNDEGAYATRERLAQELAAGSDRLAGKKIVIWEFTMRELAFGNWKKISMNCSGLDRATEPRIAN